ncbi:MAG: carboxypeptidase M32, partial [Rhabdochlamydiaceae bacterium]
MMSLTYKKLLKHSKTTHTLNSIQYLLEWDQETQMPSDGIQHRIEQISTLASTLHKHKTKPIFKKNLLQLISLEDGKVKDLSLSFQEQAVVKEWRRQYLQNKKIPSSFVQKFSSLTAASQHVWAEAKKNDDFKTFSPYL